jgi:catechol 2,3-dioxygenase-like lactoylglutathione lyase family enzyme
MRLLLALALIAPIRAQILPPNSAGVSMGHVHLNVKDIDAQKKFWIEQFGATELKREGLAGVKVPGMLILFRQQEPTGPSEGAAIDHFGFKVRSLAEMLKSCRAAGVPVVREFKGNEGFPNAYVMAPDEVKVELQEDTSLPVRAAAQHLHYMVKDVPSLQAWYVKMFGAQAGKRGTHDSDDIPGMNLTLDLNRGDTPRPGTKGRAMDHIGFEVRNLEAFCKRLEAEGVKFDIPYRRSESLGIGFAYLTDPVGSYIELTEGLSAF